MPPQEGYRLQRLHQPERLVQISETAIADVKILTPARFGDHRGFFSESWNRTTLADAGLTLPDFVQDNHSLSHNRGTVRGLHFQAPPHAQGNWCGVAAAQCLMSQWTSAPDHRPMGSGLEKS